MNMEYNIDYEKGLVETGDNRYILEVMKRAMEGKPITVGFLGGSITQDAVTSEHRLCYSYRVYEWFCKTFPKSRVEYINAGIGATDSEFAAARVNEHLLRYNPDFICMEHAVNDGCNEHNKETFEGVTRHILMHNPKQALLQMCNVLYNDGSSAELMHRRVARHYNIPVVSMRPTIYEALLKGSFDNRLITHDDLHPNDVGHGLVANVIITYLEKQLAMLKEGVLCEAKARILPSPLTKNRYETSIKYDNRDEASLTAIEGFEADRTIQNGVKDCFRNGYIAHKKGAYLEYRVEGSCIAAQYKRTVKLPAPIAKATVDGDESTAVYLDANFDETWGDKLELTDILISDNKKQHLVRIEIIEDHPDDKGEFYFASLIVSG